MKILILDSITLGDDISLDKLKELGEVITYPQSSREEAKQRITEHNPEVIITNKVVIDEAEHAGQLVGAHIDAQAGLGDAAQAGDNLFLARVVLQGDVDDTLGSVLHHLEVLDIALIQQNLSDALLHVGGGNINGVVLGVVGVADAGQHIRNRIGDMHNKSSYFRVAALSRPLRQRGIMANGAVRSRVVPNSS